jgi:hypothetical protein
MKKKVIVVIAFVIGFWGCDYSSFLSLNIDNQTNDTIKIVFSEISPYYKTVNSDSLIFYPKCKKMFYGIETMELKACYTGIKENEIKVYTSSGRKLRKDIWDINNWICNEGYYRDWEVIFVITEEDLQ